MVWKTKDLVKRTPSDNVLKDRAFRIASNSNCDGYQRGLASVVYKFFDNRPSGSGIVNEPNYQLANEFHKPIVLKLKKIKVYSSFTDNILRVDLADMHWVKIRKGSSIYFEQLIYLVNVRGLFLLKTKKQLVLLMRFKK